MYDVAIITTIVSVAVLTIIRVFERKILPSGFKRARRYKITIYCNKEDIANIQDFMASTVLRLEDFTVKRLIENPEKSKISSTFEYNRKKFMKNVYNKLCEICGPDAITIQEFHD